MAEFQSDVKMNRGGDPSAMTPFKTVFTYSALMLFFPIFMYFFSKQVIFDGLFGMESNSSVFYAAMVAVVVVHIVLGMFVWAAFNEKAPAPTLRDSKRE
ncbi:vacuolar ATPase assembly integral membrane protein vma21-like [Asterias rubens]|uniref:vacuolar ATPase assembly integral membrane protein vma21-like n=1 Tax=Asterias rubens TaxID=7604 RepID=UPI0014554455|nr:vacuolar ATPase assembly integral membrane protein vma21-like [Asterias rubens]